MARIRTYFSQKDNLQSILLKHLGRAQTKVCVAVAWFTDTVLFQKLLDLQQKGIQVELIITRHQFNDESLNDYEEINSNGGLFAQIGGDSSTMHHKFCLIDDRVVLNGSFNWTKKANRSNNETLMLIEDDLQSAFDFAAEFERLKRLAGLEQEVKTLQIGKALQYFKLIKVFIEMNRPGDMLPYLQEIKDIEELLPVTTLLLAGKYEQAVREMEAFEKRYTTVVNVSFYVKEELVFRIRLLAEQVRQLEVEKVAIEGKIEAYRHRFIIELNPILMRILELKKKLVERFGIENEAFETLREEYEQYNREVEEEQRKEVPELSETEIADIRKMYYEASKLCHPDSATCVFSDSSEAEATFDLLTKAYKARNYEEVKRIYEELKAGKCSPQDLMQSELEQLRRKLSELEKKYEQLLSLIRQIKINEPYISIEKIADWDHYFNQQKHKLEAEQADLEAKFFKP